MRSAFITKTRSCTWSKALSALCLTLAGAALAQQPTGARQLAPARLQLAGGLSAQLLSIPLDQHSLTVLATAPLLRNKGSSDASLTGLSRLLGASGASGASGARGQVLISGGFNRQDPLDAIGALVENGRSYSPLSLATKKGHYRFSGLLCIGKNGNVSIESVDSYQQSRGACRWALQAGPIVVERDRSQAISDEETATDSRLVACEPINGGRSIEFYFFEQARLRDVERGLSSRCQAALNLAGSVQAGMLLAASAGSATTIGHADMALPSVILVLPR